MICSLASKKVTLFLLDTQKEKQWIRFKMGNPITLKSESESLSQIYGIHNEQNKEFKFASYWDFAMDEKLEFQRNFLLH